ncbi:MAG: SURF1 family cytochrome oxidase biogenesis protein [Actinomycetota bacterium]
MYRFLLSRRWLLWLVLTVVFLIACVELGFWQLRRLDERKARNAAISSHIHETAVPIADVVDSAETSALEYRHVTVRGRFDVTQEVSLGGRALNDRPGSDLLTPIVTPDGRALIVNRGFVPLGVSSSAAAPPSGDVTVTGILLPSEQRGLFGQTEPAAGHLTTFVRVDVGRIGRQLPYALLAPVYMLETAQAPAQPGALPQIEPFTPDLSNGPHLSYAIQWFLFASGATIAFVVLAIRTARERTRRPTLEGDEV